MKTDSTILGLIVGLIAPTLVMLGFWQFQFGHTSLIGFYEVMIQSNNLPGLISIGLLGNLGVFFVFYRLKLDVSARGVIMATFMYGLVIVVLKFFIL
jgi:mannose/fructose/N-acetylgalactosamine-specific phosphotransferase system component IID